jgi:tetratricopeptide (TPR) repeat protein
MALRTARRHLLPVVFVLLYSTTILLFFVNARYRIPLVPILLIYSAYAIAELVARWRTSVRNRPRWRRSPLIGPACALAGLLAVSNTQLLGVRDPMLLGTLSYNLGLHLKGSGRMQEAERAFQRAVTLQPIFAPAFIQLGEIYILRKSYDRAERAFRKALALDPRRSHANRRLSQLEAYKAGQGPAPETGHQSQRRPNNKRMSART